MNDSAISTQSVPAPVQSDINDLIDADDSVAFRALSSFLVILLPLGFVDGTELNSLTKETTLFGSDR
jgi:hypothetical protein